MIAAPSLGDRVLLALRTAGTIALLEAALPVSLAVTAVALVRSRVSRLPHGSESSERSEDVAFSAKTVLLSGGKMTKSLQLARSFHAAGHRVIMVESAKYRLSAHRFSRSVGAFYTVPDASSPQYASALIDIVRREGVDVYVPVCSPVSSRYDALAKPALEEWCEVVHGNIDMVDRVDDKAAFAAAAAVLGLPVPDTHRVTDAAEVGAFDFADHQGPYVLKSIPYDPVNRLDLTRLPRPTSQQTLSFARSKPIDEATPWILQSFIGGQEYCTHGTARDGHLQVWACCESSASQLNYRMVDKPEIKAWVTKFVGELGLTGQYSFDFIERADGQVFAIECNPRTHSAITMFYDHPGLARAYLETGGAAITPTATSRPTYWIAHELWRMIRAPRTAQQGWTVIKEGKDAVFDWSDPWPFFMLHHVHIPSLLLGNLLRLQPWTKIDFNIGKLVEPGGD